MNLGNHPLIVAIYAYHLPKLLLNILYNYTQLLKELLFEENESNFSIIIVVIILPFQKVNNSNLDALNIHIISHLNSK